MPGLKSREKGKKGEREVCTLFHDYGHDARRLWQYRGNGEFPDVQGAEEFAIEVKRTAKGYNHRTAYEQAKESAVNTAMTPLVFERKDNTEWLVTMSAEDFFELLGRIKGNGDAS